MFAYAGAIATMLLYFLDGGNYLFGGILFLIANLSFGASIVFYNAFLPEIASPDRRDAVSSQGWALGYLGGGLLLVANLLLFQNADAFGVSSEHAVRISITSAGMGGRSLLSFRCWRCADAIRSNVFRRGSIM